MDELPVFSERELYMAKIPGFGSDANIWDIAAFESEWEPVLSLSVFRRNPEDLEQIQTLTGIRRNSSTHDKVVSTLTGTFPPAFQNGLLLNRHPYRVRGDYPVVRIGDEGPNPLETALVESYIPNPDLFPDNHNPLPFLCHDIFARKLDRSDLLQLRFGEQHIGTVSLSEIRIGVSYVGHEKHNPDEAVFEPLVMYGAAMMLNEAYADIFPMETSRYSHLGWTDDIQTFPEDVRSRDVRKLAPAVREAEEFEVCARGLCLATTAGVTQTPDLMGHLGLAA